MLSRLLRHGIKQLQCMYSFWGWGRGCGWWSMAIAPADVWGLDLLWAACLSTCENKQLSSFFFFPLIIICMWPAHLHLTVPVCGKQCLNGDSWTKKGARNLSMGHPDHLCHSGHLSPRPLHLSPWFSGEWNKVPWNQQNLHWTSGFW